MCKQASRVAQSSSSSFPYLGVVFAWPSLVANMHSLELPQQAWLQGMMAHRIVSEQQAKAMHKAALRACRMPSDAGEYEEAFAAVARGLEPIGLEIRRMVDEVNGTHLVAIVNTKDDEIAQMATGFTSHEIAYVKALVADIFTAPGNAYSLSSTNALDLGRDLDPEMPATKADAVCKKLVRQGWLRERSGCYSLTPRSLLELQSYLRSAHEEYVHMCTVCKDIVTCGLACSTPDCGTYIHAHCRLRFEAAMPSKSEEQLCVKCKRQWQPLSVGDPENAQSTRRRRADRRTTETRRAEEGAADDGGKNASQSTVRLRDSRRPSSSPRTAKRRRSEASELEDETVPLDDDEEGDEEYETASN